MLRKILPYVLLNVGMLIQVSPAPLRALTLGPGGLAPAAIPAGAVPVARLLQADFDGDGQPETLSLTGGRVFILSHGQTVWQSPPAWQVIQAEITDLDHDDVPEATLLVWRPFQPWPVDRWLPSGGRIADFHDAGGYSCHIILVGWVRGGYQEVWAGSALAEPVKAFAAADLNGDGLQELVTLEGSYADSRPRPETPEGSAPARALKVWEWNSFGFTIVSKVEGTFDKMALVPARNGRILILVP